MAFDPTNARAVLANALFGDEFIILRPRVIDNGAGSTKPHPDGPEELGPFPCGFGVNKMRTAEGGEEQLVHRGSYRLKTLVEHEVLSSDQVVYRGKTYNVVWAPPISAIALKRVVGLEEAPEEA